MSLAAQSGTTEKMGSSCPLDCAVCPKRKTCLKRSYIEENDGHCHGEQGLAEARGGFLELPRDKSLGRPLLKLEWSADRIKIFRERLECVSFDPGGRLFSISAKGSIWRRGLDGRILEIYHAQDPSVAMSACQFHDGRLTSREEAAEWEKWLVAFMKQARYFFGDHPELKALQDLDMADDAKRFLEIFRPIGILPPDQYRSLVLQITRGCSYNKCAFCDFYKRDQYRLKGLEEFSEHVRQALSFFGRSLQARHGIFLGEANAVNIPTDHLLTCLSNLQQIIRESAETAYLPKRQFADICSFLDTFSVKRSVDEWRELKRLGLHRLYLGIESGSDQVLRFLQKPGSFEKTLELVRNLKAAGLAVGPILMTGVGGREMAEEHVKETAALLNAMPLDPDDHIYLSEFMLVPGSAYEKKARELGLHGFNRLQCREQSRVLREMLRYKNPPYGPLVALYDVRQFIY